jgi:predicted nucleic acid-binding protein
MKVLLDTNIIMDALQERQPFDVQAKEILRLAQSGAITAMFTANAAADIFYLFSKARDIESARAALEFLLNRYGAVDVSHTDCVNALQIPYDDFEDALAVVCAVKMQADFIITRDMDFLKASLPVKTISPDGFLSELCL